MAVPYAELIGDPVAHSKSPTIHRFWLREMGIVGDYRALRLGPDELAGYLARRRSDPDWRGCNVTMPYKEKVADLLDGVDPFARRIGAVNTVVNRDGFLIGTNTDWQGVNLALEPVGAAGKRVVLIGAGGAARAAVEELRQAEAAHLTILNRSEDKARDLLLRFGGRGATGPVGGDPEADLLINATPLGMAGQPPLAVGLSRLSDAATVFDMVYDPLETELLAEARRRGFRIVDGLAMLVWQASMAFTHFFGEPPPGPDSPRLRELLAS
ncbi:MAG TPA: shikimate dehydrogenase [Allosphingosinicella sp.]|nr:shikimate dehydrogenase [Allosphingosinicella sp.]